MQRRDPPHGHRFSKGIILFALPRYCRYPLSLPEVRDLLAERGISADVTMIHRWVTKANRDVVQAPRQIKEAGR